MGSSTVKKAGTTPRAVKAARSNVAKKAWATRRANEKRKCPRCSKADKVKANRGALHCERCDHGWLDRDAVFPLIGVPATHPMQGEAREWELRRFGSDIIAKGTRENGAVYVWYRATLWKPSGDPVADRVEAWSFLRLEDGSLFENKDPRLAFFPTRLPQSQDPHDIEKTWRKAEQRRILAVIGQVHPEVFAEDVIVGNDGVVSIFVPGTFLDSSDLDAICDYAGDDALDRFVGTAVEHDALGRTGTLVRSKKGPRHLVRWVTECMNGDSDPETGEALPCPHKKKVTFHTRSGCHHGAWCYLTDPKTGKHLGDLRNVMVYCDKCS